MNNKVDIYSLTLTRGLWRLGEYDSKQVGLEWGGVEGEKM